ncbi:MAG TPA: Arc family DNA-binding protein [Lamprocystis sp. (in: g-proteobacteria)]|nr:Arc family DNA-binding protein [Lamprocystis sp. (in: g-proteobacteria)]
MADLTIRGVPDELHAWLKEQARAHHRSVNREAIALIESMRAGTAPARLRPSAQAILARASRFASLPVLDARTANEILGYDDNGLPGR